MTKVSVPIKKDTVKITVKKPTIKVNVRKETVKVNVRSGYLQNIPAEGLIGQVLTLVSTDPRRYEWQTPSVTESDGSDKHFTKTFIDSDDVTVTHNLNKTPTVTVLDTANDECEGFVTHNSLNEFRVQFSAPFSGIIICN